MICSQIFSFVEKTAIKVFQNYTSIFEKQKNKTNVITNEIRFKIPF